MPKTEVFVPTDSSTMLGGRATRFDQPVSRLCLRSVEESLDESDSELEATRFSFNCLSAALCSLTVL
jgi:hypothetical protein